MTAHAQTLVAGIGNIFLGDDGFGSEVARVLAGMELPADVKVVDFGIRGLDLAYALLEPYRTVILVDAISRKGEAGTIYLMQPAGDTRDAAYVPDPHAMDPMHLLALAHSLGEVSAEVFILGCEPLDFGEELEGRMSLSEPVARAVPEAARALLELLQSTRQRGASSCKWQAEAPCLQGETL